MSQMLKSSSAMGAATFLSRVLGLVREILYARFMGVSAVAAAFQYAYLIPGLFRRLLGEGALTAAFIPVFKEKEKMGTREEMWESANVVLSGLIFVASVITALILLGVTLVLWFGQVAPETRLMLELVRIMFPYMIVVCVAAVLMGMLNARGYFFIPALGATMLNVVMIPVVLFVAPRFGAELQTQVYALALGVVLAGFAQAAFQIPALRREGYRFRWIKPWPNPTTRVVVERMAAGVLGIAAIQINILTTQSIAFVVDEQIVAAFGYAVRLMEFPQGLFGVSLATYLLPTLSGYAVEKKFVEFRASLTEGLGYVVFLNAIAFVALLVLAEPIVRLLLERGEFDRIDTQSVSYALACLSPSLIAYSMASILARAFYAMGDTKTPMKISAVCLLFNIFLTAWLIMPFKEGGLGIANSVSASVNVVLLVYALKKKLSKLSLSLLGRELGLILVATALSCGVAFAVSYGWETKIGAGDLVRKLGAVFVPLAVTALFYWGFLLAVKSPQAHEMLKFVRKQS